MPRKRMETKVKEIKKRVPRRICIRKRMLNLPDPLWQAYKNSQPPIEQNKEFLHTEENKNCVDEEKKMPLILKQLSVKLDNYLLFPNNWNTLTQKLNEGIEVHKSMYQNLINAKQILVFSSSNETIQKTEINDSLIQQIVTADLQLEEVIKSMHKQEDLLLNCKKIFDDMTLPLQIMNTTFIEDSNQQRLSNSFESKEIELQNEKPNFVQAELKQYQDKFFRMTNSFKKSMQEKNKIISQLKLKLYNTKKRLLKIYKTQKIENDINVNPMENQIHQLTTVMELAYSMLGNIKDNQISAGNITADKKDNIIKVLKQQMQELKDQNKRKDKEINRLLESEECAKTETLKAEERNIKMAKEKDFKINQLMSALNELKRKHDRWLMDRYFQKCHSIMLFEKIRQVEKNQLALVEVKSEYKNYERKI